MEYLQSFAPSARYFALPSKGCQNIDKFFKEIAIRGLEYIDILEQVDKAGNNDVTMSYQRILTDCGFCVVCLNALKLSLLADFSSTSCARTNPVPFSNTAISHSELQWSCDCYLHGGFRFF